MDVKDLKELVETDFPDMGPITSEVRKRIIKTSQSYEYSNLPVRIAMGRFYTDEEYEKHRNKI